MVIMMSKKNLLHGTVATKHHACSLKGSCQDKSHVYSCKISTSDLKQNQLHYIGLTEHIFKDRLYKHNNSFK